MTYFKDVKRTKNERERGRERERERERELVFTEIAVSVDIDLHVHKFISFFVIPFAIKILFFVLFIENTE